jgi:TIGR03009 family protein
MHRNLLGLMSVLALTSVLAQAPAAMAQDRYQPRVAQNPRSVQQPPKQSGEAPAKAVAPRRTSDSAPADNDKKPSPSSAPANAQGQRQAPAGAAPQNLGPKAPFVLTEAEQKLLDQILIKWEQQSEKVRTFKCEFKRWEYDPTWGDPKNNNLKSEGDGYIKFKTPDRGEYAVSKLNEYNFDKRVYQPKSDNLDRWTCDGKSIFEFNAQKKQVIERKLPPEMQGKAISDGPLPFVFGAKAEQLKRRYWMRDITPKEDIGKTIWLEARPKYQQDAANFDKAVVMLNEADFMPAALRISLPGSEATIRRDGKEPGKSAQEANLTYSFVSRKVNDPLDRVLDVLTPRVPLGWKLVVEQAPESDSKNPPPSQDAAGQAKRPNASTRRK